MERPSVAIIILNWNNYRETRDCVDSALQFEYPEFQIILVDNGSTDKSLSQLREDFSEIEIIENNENLGFAGGMNVGIERALDADYDYVLLVNNDVRFPDTNMLSVLVEAMEEHTGLGCISPLIDVKPSVYKKQGLRPSDIRIGRTKPLRERFPYDTLTYGVHYCCVLFPSYVLEEVGLLPEKYFLYIEDISHGASIEDCCYWLSTAPSTYVSHKGQGSSSSQLGPIVSYYDTRNRIVFCNDRLNTFVYILWLCYFSIFLTKQIVLRLYHGEISGSFAMIRGVVDGLRGEVGRGPYP